MAFSDEKNLDIQNRITKISLIYDINNFVITDQNSNEKVFIDQDSNFKELSGSDLLTAENIFLILLGKFLRFLDIVKLVWFY